MVRLAATAVNKHFSKQNLGVHNPGVCGTCHPGATFRRICRDAAAFEQHAAIPVLGGRDALCSAAEP